MSEKLDELTPLQKAVIAIKELRGKLDAAEAARHEPIAIIGMGCRFPGEADTPEAFWELLRMGKDAVVPVPPSRWDIERFFDANPDAAGKMYVREGGYLNHIDEFDPQFFGITPREAQSMDPQQRLLLMVAWEALERAGQAPPSLKNSATGIFVGMGQMDYAQRRMYGGDPAVIEAYDGTGNGFSFAAGRLAYTLGSQGPTMAIDTACSSSLVAVHLACQSLRQGESDLALAGGVQLSLSPEVSIFLSRTKALAPDGRCKTFDAAADGFGRGEGCGVLVLKRLSDALAERDPIVAIIRGSAVNHDGPSSGLTVPNALAQEKLIRQALRDARLSPQEISYIEAHGTGTSLGDPLEVEAVGTVFAERTEPLWVGSVKTNFGHLEAAAGVAGLMKVIVALQHGQIPPHLHFQQPNPRLEWDKLPIQVTAQAVPWPRGEKVRAAGVSSFGISGTNVHIVVSEAPPIEAVAQDERPWHLLTLSAKSKEQLRELIARYEQFLAETEEKVADICYTSNVGRAHFRERIAVIGATVAELRQGLHEAQMYNNGQVESEKQEIMRLRERYLAGESIDWAAWHPSHKRRKVILPTYPFARERYWLERPQGAKPSLGTAAELLVKLEQVGRLTGEQMAVLPALLPELLAVLQGETAVTSLLYELMWERKVITARGRPTKGKWLILADQKGTSEVIAHKLRSVGVVCHVVTAADHFERVNEFTWQVVPNKAADWQRLLAATGPLEHVVHGWALDMPLGQITAAHLERAQVWGVEALVVLVRQLAQMTALPKLWVMTRQSVAVTKGDALSGLAMSLLWGLGKVMALEYAGLWGGLLDIDRPDDSVTQLISVIHGGTAETMMAWRQGVAFVPRLARKAAVFSTPKTLDKAGVYLITGGTGALGLAVAQKLVDEGARHLLLVSRRGVGHERQREAIAKLEMAGAMVQVAEVDVADEAAVRGLLTPLERPLKGVIHSAGVLDNALLADLTEAQIDKVLRPKVWGSWVLHEVTQGLELDFFVCFSSIASVWGSKIQGNYAAANSFLDALVAYRQARGLPALTINWGPWSGGGMAAAEAREQLVRLGVRPLTMQGGIEQFGKLLGEQGQVVVADVEWEQFAAVYGLNRQGMLFERLVRGASEVVAEEGRRVVFAQENLAERREALLAFVQEEVAVIMGFTRGKRPRVEQGLADMGLDSMMAVELRKRLSQKLGVSLSATVAFDYPTIELLAEYVGDEVLKWGEEIVRGEEIEENEKVIGDMKDDFDDEVAAKLAYLESLLD